MWLAFRKTVDQSASDSRGVDMVAWKREIGENIEQRDAH